MRPARGSLEDRTHFLSTRTTDQPQHSERARVSVDDPDNLRGKGYRHLLILVHGFNNTTAAAAESYRLQRGILEEYLSQKPRSAPDAIAFFHWPGNVGPALLSFAGYPWDIRQASYSAALLARYLARFPRPADPGAFKITIIGHSLGCRLILEMLSKLPPRSRRTVQVVSLMAPAVPVELADIGGVLHSTILSSRLILKCYSHWDQVLRFAFPNGQQAAFAFKIEPKFYGEAIGLNGNPTAMGQSVKTRHGHSRYWGDQAVAEEYCKAVDATVRPLPYATQPAVRSLPESSEIQTRQLSEWQ